MIYIYNLAYHLDFKNMKDFSQNISFFFFTFKDLLLKLREDNHKITVTFHQFKKKKNKKKVRLCGPCLLPPNPTNPQSPPLISH